MQVKKPRLNSVSQKTYINPQGLIVNNVIHDLSIYAEREKECADPKYYICLNNSDEPGCKDINRGSFLFGKKLPRHGVSLEHHRNVFTSWNRFCIPRTVYDSAKNPEDIKKSIRDYLDKHYELIGIAQTESNYISVDMVSQDPNVLLAGLVEITNNSDQNITFSDLLYIDWPEIVVDNNIPSFKKQNHLTGIPENKITGLVRVLNREDINLQNVINNTLGTTPGVTRDEMIDKILTLMNRVILKSLGHARPHEHLSVKIHGSNTVM